MGNVEGSFSRSGGPGKFIPRSFNVQKTTPQTRQASVSMLNVEVRDRIDRKRVSCFEGLPGESLSSLRRTLQSLDGQCASEQTTRRLQQCSDKISVKHSRSTSTSCKTGDRDVKLWPVLGHFAVIESAMNSCESRSSLLKYKHSIRKCCCLSDN